MTVEKLIFVEIDRKTSEGQQMNRIWKNMRALSYPHPKGVKKQTTGGTNTQPKCKVVVQHIGG